MALDTKRTGGPTAANPSENIQNSNGNIQHSTTPASVAVNRKKAKRRAKQAAKQAVNNEQPGTDEDPDSDGPLPSTGQLPRSQNYLDPSYNPSLHYSDPPYADADQAGDFAYSDEESRYAYPANSHVANGVSVDYAGDAGQARRKGKKKKRDTSSAYDPVHDEPGGPSTHPHQHAYAHRSSTAITPRAISDDALRTVQRGINNGIWNTSSAEERQRIKEYWLSLGEDERKALVKIEKNDVLKKMKDQQKSACSCTVCGRKRVAIEEELEVLYDAYYQELEHYANHNQHLSPNGTSILPPSRRYSSSSANKPHSNGITSEEHQRRPARGRIHEVHGDADEEDLDEEELDEDEFSEDEYDDDYSVDGHEGLPQPASEFFTFGKSLTVKGGILTVADDLLKNDGQKFIDMMEQLAERRMAREEQAHKYAPYTSHPSIPPPHNHADHSHLPPEDEEYDEEEDEEYGSEDDDYDDEDEVDAMTEGQRMDEGRRMFQIFAARMFEQRVLTAYREERAKERTKAFLEELEAAETAKSEAAAKNAAKKAKQKQKEKAKKDALKEEKARKAEEKAAAERAEEEKKMEEKRKRDEENRKKEEERKRKIEAGRIAQEEERQRKKAEEREREEARRAREQKVKDKREREETVKREREAKERERKLQQEREEMEKHEQVRVEKEAQDSRRKTEQAAQATNAGLPNTSIVTPVPTQPTEPSRRMPLPAIVALPPSLKSKQSNLSHESPQTKVATPVMPKPPTPVRPKDPSSRVSQTSTPATPETAPQSKQSSPPPKTPAPPNIMQPSALPRMRTPNHFPPVSLGSQASPMHTIAPPPGMHLQQNTHMGMPHIGPNGFPGAPGPMMHAMMPRLPLGHQMPMYPPHVPQMGPHHRPFMHPSAGAPPPGINPPQLQQHGRGYLPEPVPPLSQHIQAALGGTTQQSYASTRENIQLPHSRQTSTSFDTSPAEPQTPASATQPIARPAPIKRPASVKPHEGIADSYKTGTSDIDDLSTRLGSSALLDDNDEPLPVSMDNRRTSAPLGNSMNSANHGLIGSPFDHIQSPFHMGGHGGTADSWRSPASQYGPPTASTGWGQTSSSSGWGNVGPFPTMIHHRGVNPRPVTVRLLACKACKSLSNQNPGLDGGFHDFGDVYRLVGEFARQSQDPMVTPLEVSDILDTEGDAHNGGGSFLVRKEMSRGGKTLVKWQPDASELGMGRAGLGLGEIGSPLPGNSIPALGGLGLGSRGF